MKNILVSGAGNAPSEGVINSLLSQQKIREIETIFGSNCDLYDLALSKAHKKLVIPHCRDDQYKNILLKTINDQNLDLIHFQNDLELYIFSSFRGEVDSSKYYLPNHKTIEKCTNKYESYKVWRANGLKVPETILVNNIDDLNKGFSSLANNSVGMVWLRSVKISGGGLGALPTNDRELAKKWIDTYRGWGSFTVSELLSEDSVTWQSLWYEGELVVAQSRRRHGWSFGNRTLSGVTGLTRVGETFSDEKVDRLAQDAILSVDSKPHGLFGVDMTLDQDRVSNLTEINIGRFFTTILFFTEAGLNIPEMYKNIALYHEFPSLNKKINPLPDGLLWIRGLDSLPVLMKRTDLSRITE